MIVYTGSSDHHGKTDQHPVKLLDIQWLAAYMSEVVTNTVEIQESDTTDCQNQNE
jgi:hypothetical protein